MVQSPSSAWRADHEIDPDMTDTRNSTANKNSRNSQIYTLQRIVMTTQSAIKDNTHTAPARFMRRSRAMRLGSVSGLSVILISSRASIRFGNLLIIAGY